jgi:hypothetical protein
MQSPCATTALQTSVARVGNGGGEDGGRASDTPAMASISLQMREPPESERLTRIHGHDGPKRGSTSKQRSPLNLSPPAYAFAPSPRRWRRRWGIRPREQHLPAQRRRLTHSLPRRLLCTGVVHVPCGLRGHPRSSLPPPLAFPGPHPSSPSQKLSGTLAESAASTVVPRSPSPSQNDSSA